MSKTTFFTIYNKEHLSAIEPKVRFSKSKLVELVDVFREMFRIPETQMLLTDIAANVLADETKYVGLVKINVSPVVFTCFDFKEKYIEGEKTKLVHPNILLVLDVQTSLYKDVEILNSIRYKTF